MYNRIKVERGLYMWEHFLHYFHRINKVLDDINFGFILEIFVNIVILAVIFKFLDIFEAKMKQKVEQSSQNSQMSKIIPAVNRILKFLVFFIILASFLQTHGYSVSSLIAGFGITGLAVGFAANSALANIFGTISLISDKSYKIGDYIKFGSYEGTVEEINMRSTKIRTLDNALTIIPNSSLANGEIVNVTAAHRKRLYENIGVTYDTSNEKLERAVKVIEEILRDNKDIADDYIVNLNELSDSSINIRVNAYVKTKSLNKYLKIKEIFFMELIKRFREEGIDFAFPSQTIYIAGQNNEN